VTTMTDDLTPPTTPTRVLRRSDSDRMLAGVSGGLGEYFGVDPVLFRVLFGVSAFFGGFGVLAYLIAWAIIPERGAQHAVIDRLIAALRRRNVPVWVAFGAITVVALIALFGWHRPWPFAPLILLAILLVIVLGRRRRPAAMPAAPVDTTAGYSPPPAATDTRTELKAWVAETRSARQARRSHNRPIRVATWSVLVLTLIGLGIADAVTGIRIPVYFWTIGGIVIAALIVGAIIRRPVWGFAFLLIPTTIGVLALGGTKVSLHDGSGDRQLTPTSSGQLPADSRMAFGRTTLDLRQLPTSDTGSARIEQATGQVKIIVPRASDVRVHAALRLGTIQVDGAELHSGYNFDRDVVTGTGNAITVNVRLEDGAVTIEHAG
jgi:phage shock protein PspC (stress-responsive transcriptional regulator)